jgi:hypothetical protein
MGIVPIGEAVRELGAAARAVIAPWKGISRTAPALAPIENPTSVSAATPMSGLRTSRLIPVVPTLDPWSD